MGERQELWVDLAETQVPEFRPIGFLIESRVKGITRLAFHGRPGAKNLSGERVLRGWLGETNHINRTASGAVELIRVSETDEGRVFVRRLADSDPRVLQLCDELGATV